MVENDKNLNPGERLREARLQLGLTQEQLGKMLGYSRDHISRIERGALPFPSSLDEDAFLRAGINPIAVVFGLEQSDEQDKVNRNILLVRDDFSVISLNGYLIDKEEGKPEELVWFVKSPFFGDSQSVFKYHGEGFADEVKNGDLVFVDRLNDIQNGDIVVEVGVDSEGPILFKVKTLNNGDLLFTNNDGSDMFVKTPEEAREYRALIGKVAYISRRMREKEMEVLLD